jgi:hypothetical protein
METYISSSNTKIAKWLIINHLKIATMIDWTAWKITWNVADPCFLICGLDCFYTGNAKNYGSCPLDKILSSGYLANPCLCFWTTNFIQWLAVHWISSRPVDNLIQWITLSSILNNRAQLFNIYSEFFSQSCNFVNFWQICKFYRNSFENFKIQFCTNKWPRVYWAQVLEDQYWAYATICNSFLNRLSQVSDTDLWASSLQYIQVKHWQFTVNWSYT